MSNSFDPDQAQHFVRPDLGTNCLQRLSGYQQMILGGKDLNMREIDPDLMPFIFQDYFTEQLERDSVTPLPKVVTNEFNAAERLVFTLLHHCLK